MSRKGSFQNFLFCLRIDQNVFVLCVQKRIMVQNEGNTSIGVATMKKDGTIVLMLRAEGPIGILGDSMFEYRPDHPKYKNILEHLGGIRPGEEKQVPPFD